MIIGHDVRLRLARLNDGNPQYRSEHSLMRLSDKHPSGHVAYAQGVAFQSVYLASRCGMTLDPDKMVPAEDGQRLCDKCARWLEKYTDKVLVLDSWQTPATDYPLDAGETARLVRDTYTPGFYPYWGMDNYLYFQVKRTIPITALQLLEEDGKWRTWMVDDPPQLRAMQLYAKSATGRVLVAGLGLGLVALELHQNPYVDEIWVVERNPDVIALVERHLPVEITVVEDDFLNYVKTHESHWDTIIVDLWVSVSAKEKVKLYYTEVLPLHANLRLRYPQARISYHGFYDVSDTKIVTQEAMDLIEKYRPYGEKR